ncbi:armadillo repeat-containing protein 3-like [Limulus polyphemus]|uniref:Armadillo repeat-containing protein 3-like n=1 Tax=Limulus polyphemus TaxID=6850 RepID=A0ABM1TEY7_LIMPO|nr:armadillo repeat-containing protein 3-like [Limulus polyphemus]
MADKKRKGKKDEIPQPSTIEVTEKVLIESNNNTTFILMLQSKEENVLYTACDAILKVAKKGDRSKEELVSLGAVPPVLQLFSHAILDIQRYAAMTMTYLISVDSAIKQFVQLDGISLTLKALAIEDLSMQEFLTAILVYVAGHSDYRNEIIVNNGVAVLLKKLDSSNSDVQKNSVEILKCLFENPEAVNQFCEAGGLRILFSLLSSQFPVIQVLALNVLQKCAKNESCRKWILLKDGVDQLMEILYNDEFSDLHASTLGILLECASSPDIVVYLQKVSAINNFLSFVEGTEDNETKQLSLSILAKMAQTNEFRDLLHCDGIEKNLHQLLNHHSQSVQTAAAEVITEMAASHSSKESFLNLGTVNQLSTLLQTSSDVHLLQALISSLSVLTTGSLKSCRIIFETGGLKPLVEVIKTDVCDEILESSLTCLRNLGIYYLAREKAVECGVVPVLLKFLNCISSVKNFLLFQHYLVYCLHGILLLFSIFVGLSSQQHLFQWLLKSLLKMEPSDSTYDGFYDTGAMRLGEMFGTLEDYRSRPVDARRPVLIVNTTIFPSLPCCTSTNSEASVSLSSEQDTKDSPQMKTKTSQLQKNVPSSPPGSVMDPTVTDLPSDPRLHTFVHQVETLLDSASDMKSQLQLLAQFVSDKMGGAVQVGQDLALGVELHLNELKNNLQCNALPLGYLKKGSFSHRALLFKVLADKVLLPCSLVRGTYGRAWNEILVLGGFLQDERPYTLSERYIVDVMHIPGRLLHPDSTEAAEYMHI